MKMATILKMADRVFRRVNWRVAAALAGLSFCKKTGEFDWMVGPFEGHVYDAETKQPIQGAQIYVQWARPAPFAREIILDEATAETDINGHYYVPKVNNPEGYGITSYEFYLYKFGYICFDPSGGYDNVYLPEGWSERTSGRWRRYAIPMDNNEIYLKKWEGWSPKKNEKHLSYCGPTDSACWYFYSLGKLGENSK
jgi:hypothetical protein